MAAVTELTGKVELSDRRLFGEVKKGFTRFTDNDLLVAKITPSMENGKSAVVRGLENGVGCGSTEFHVIRSERGIEPDYLRHFVTQKSFRQVARQNMQGAVGQQRVPPDFLRDASIPIPPTAEQRRVVSKLEELFSSIDEGERALKRVRKLVERYRQSVLKAAVTGELTREWREQHAGRLESGEALLTRVLDARRQAWEQSELAKMTAKGCRPKNDAWKRRYKEPHTPDTESSDSLPAGWVWATIDQLCGLVTSGSRGWKEFYSKTGSTFIRAQNLKHDVLCLDDVAFVDLSTVTEGLRTRVLKHDLLVTITGANVTKSALVEDTIDDAYVSQHVALVRPVDSSLSKFLFQWIVSESNGRRQLLSAAYGAGKPGLNLEDVKDVLVALPSTSEQRVICDRLDSELSRLSYVLKTTRTQKDAALALRQSVLKAAFSGQLVPQHSTDGPASVLLERIAAERAATLKRAVTKQPREKKTKSKAKA